MHVNTPLWRAEFMLFILSQDEQLLFQSFLPCSVRSILPPSHQQALPSAQETTANLFSYLNSCLHTCAARALPLGHLFSPSLHYS